MAHQLGHVRQPDLRGHARGERPGHRGLDRRGPGDRRGPRRPRDQHRRRAAPRHGRPRVGLLRLQRLRGGDLLAARPRLRPDRLPRHRRPPRRRRPGRVLRRRPRADDLDAPAPADAVAGHRLRLRARQRPASGTAVNLALPPGTRDQGWLRAFSAVVPSLLGAFRPQILVTQCGVDTHHEDPLAELSLTVDGHRAIYSTAARAGGRVLGRQVARPRRGRLRALPRGAPVLDPPAGHRPRPRRRARTARSPRTGRRTPPRRPGARCRRR